MELKESTTLNTEDDNIYFLETSSKLCSKLDGVFREHVLPVSKSTVEIITVLRQSRRSHLSIDAYVHLKEIEEDNRKMVEKNAERQKKELEEFAKNVEKDVQEKITEQSLLMGNDSSEEVEEVHWTDEEEQQSAQRESPVKRRGQMIFSANGDLQVQPPTKKRVEKKKK